MIESVGVYSISFRPKHLDTFIAWAAAEQEKRQQKWDGAPATKS